MKWFQTTSLNSGFKLLVWIEIKQMRNQTSLKPFDVKSILTYNIDGMVFCFIEDYVFGGNMILIITLILLL